MVSGFSFHSGNCRDSEALTLPDGAFSEHIAAQVSGGRSRRDEGESGGRQQQPGRIRVANGAAQDGQVDQVGPVPGVAVHVAKSGRVRAGVYGKTASRS